MLIDYVLGQTSVVVRVKIRNSSVSTGAGLTGLSNASSGLRIAAIADVEATTTSYTSAGSTIQAIATLGTFAAPTSGDCRFAQVDPTNHPGIYEIQLDNARYAASGAKSLLVSITGATNAADCDVVIPLRQVNPYSSTSFIAGVAGIAPPSNWATPVPTAAAIATASAAAILATPAHPLQTDASGNAQISMTQAVPTTNAAQTAGDALNAARAQGFGAWTISGTSWVIYAGDGVTPVRTFALNSSTTPTSRS